MDYLVQSDEGQSGFATRVCKKRPPYRHFLLRPIINIAPYIQMVVFVRFPDVVRVL